MLSAVVRSAQPPAWWHNVGCTRPDRCTPRDHITALIAWWAHPRNPGPYHRLDPAHPAFNPNRRRHLLEPRHQIYWPPPSFPTTARCLDRVVVYVAPQTGVAEPHRILLLPLLYRLLVWRQHQPPPSSRAVPSWDPIHPHPRRDAFNALRTGTSVACVPTRRGSRDPHDWCATGVACNSPFWQGATTLGRGRWRWILSHVARIWRKARIFGLSSPRKHEFLC
jgi:hypothetical protein